MARVPPQGRSSDATRRDFDFIEKAEGKECLM
jgi:hypothetical protein